MPTAPKCRTCGVSEWGHTCGGGRSAALLPGVRRASAVTPSVTPVTKAVTVTPNVTQPVTPNVTPSATAAPGELCPCCGQRVPMTAADRQRRARARKATAPHNGTGGDTPASQP